MIALDKIREAAKACLLDAGTTYHPDQLAAYENAVKTETDQNAKWVLEKILENGLIAAKERLPLCDDTGIPHVIVEIGDECELPAGWMRAIRQGIADGLTQLPGRPMAVLGNDIERVEQSRGLAEDPAAMGPAPFITRSQPGEELKISVLMLGGGPEIRARTRRIFHRRSIHTVLNEVISWLGEEVQSLGCSPITAAIGIGRSQVEASALMLEAMATGRLDKQNEWERLVTEGLNKTKVGPLGMGGNKTALGCFLNIGPTRASGVRIVCARPCCLVEPRKGTAVLK